MGKLSPRIPREHSKYHGSTLLGVHPSLSPETSDFTTFFPKSNPKKNLPGRDGVSPTGRFDFLCFLLSHDGSMCLSNEKKHGGCLGLYKG